MSEQYLGRSGCLLEITQDLKIRKFSGNANYDQRLRAQASKQSSFLSNKYQNLHTPEVFNLYEGDIFSFDMQYIPGSTFVDFFSTSSVDSLINTSDILINFIKTNLKESKIIKINEQVIEKIRSLSEQSKYSDICTSLVKYIETIDLQVPVSYCHGDLTLNNMLFVDSEIYLIDFLDSFIDSPIIDLVKLKQDLVYSWSQELQKIRKTRMITAFKFLWCTIEDSFKDLTCSRTFKVMEVVNFLRIEPYVTSEIESKLLDKIIKGLAIYEELDIANGG